MKICLWHWDVKQKRNHDTLIAWHLHTIVNEQLTKKRSTMKHSTNPLSAFYLMYHLIQLYCHRRIISSYHETILLFILVHSVIPMLCLANLQKTTTLTDHWHHYIVSDIHENGKGHRRQVVRLFVGTKSSRITSQVNVTFITHTVSCTFCVCMCKSLIYLRSVLWTLIFNLCAWYFHWKSFLARKPTLWLEKKAFISKVA